MEVSLSDVSGVSKSIYLCKHREREREREREEVSESLALLCFFCSVCTEGDEKKGWLYPA